MGERLGEALLDLDTDDRKFNQGVDRAGRKAEGLGKVLDDTARRAAKLGAAMVAAAGVAGVAALTAGITSAVKRLEEMSKMSGRVDRALKNSGNTARTSAREIEAWADALENRTGRAVEEVMEVSANLASYGFGRDEFYRAIALADDMAAAWGGDLRQNLEGLSRALDDPINGMAMLSKRGIKLTQEQKDMAAAFLDAGNKVAAQGVVFDALEEQVKGVAEAGFNGLTKAIAQAQKVWETAFEDLVTGKGTTNDLRTSLEQIISTLSSPEFVDAAMGFGSLLVQTIDAIAKAAVFAHGKLKEFFAWLDGRNPANMSADTLSTQIAAQQAAIQKAEDQLYRSGFWDDKGGWFGSSVGAADGIANMRRELDAMLAEQARRTNPSMFDVGGSFDKLGSKTYDSTEAMWAALGWRPDGGGGPTGPSGLSEEARKQADAVKELIAELQHERDIVGETALEQQILNTIRRAGVDATSAQGEEIRRLITETENHRAQIEQMEEVYGLLGDIGKSAIMGIVDAMSDGKVEGEELLSILGNVLSMAGSFFLNEAFSGGSQGGFGSLLSGLFAGFFADGGLIPNGSFGIVGEEGPEPVIGTAGGARVLPNSTLTDMLGGGQRGDTHVTVSGSGLSQGELTQAIADALDRYDRFQLPGRVSAIQGDPYARG